jgi:hypothetical protein
LCIAKSCRYLKKRIPEANERISSLSVYSGQVKENEVFLDQPDTLEVKNCMTRLLSDSNVFSKMEIHFIQQQAKKPLIGKWDSTLLAGRFATRKMVDSVFKKDGWQSFYKTYGWSLNSFSAPVFLRNYTLCLFYSGYSCGELCGSGALNLYKKENGKWKVYKRYCSWIS